MTFDPETDLEIEREIKASPATVWRCWSEPDLFRKWFVPPPVKVTRLDHDLVSGGRALTVFEMPDGSEMENDGAFVLVEPERRIVMTDGMLAGFRPLPTCFMVADITLTPISDGTLYRAHVMHTDADKRQEHENMGFHEGWGTTLGQLKALAENL